MVGRWPCVRKYCWHTARSRSVRGGPDVLSSVGSTLGRCGTIVRRRHTVAQTGSRPTCAAAIQISCRERLDYIANSWDPVEVSLFMRARTASGRSRRLRTQFGGSSSCSCHHAHLAQARTGRGGYRIGNKEPKSGLFWSAILRSRILPFGSSSEMAETRVDSRFEISRVSG